MAVCLIGVDVVIYWGLLFESYLNDWIHTINVIVGCTSSKVEG